MSPLACSEMYPLKLGHDPGRRQATRYQPCRGYFTFTAYCALFFCTLTLLYRFFLRMLALYFLRTYPGVRLFSAHLPCCAVILLRTYPAVPLFFCALTTRRNSPSRDGIDRADAISSKLSPLLLPFRQPLFRFNVVQPACNQTEIFMCMITAVSSTAPKLFSRTPIPHLPHTNSKTSFVHSQHPTPFYS